MYTWKLLGRYLPDTVTISFPTRQSFPVTWPGNGEAIISFDCAGSEIICYVESEQVWDDNQLRILCARMIQFRLDILGFHHGHAFFVFMHEVTRPDGNILRYDSSLPSSAINLQNPPADIGAMEKTSNHTYSTMQALSDLRQAILFHHDSALHCFRAIEAIRQFFIPDDADDTSAAKNQSWIQMRAALNIEKSYIDPLTDKSTKVRHAAPLYLSPSEREELIKRTYQIINRFMIYCNSEYTQLDKNTHNALA